MKYIITFLISIFCSSAFAQYQFQKYFSELTEYPQFAYSAFDSTYVMAASRKGSGVVYDFCVAKVDRYGSIRWSKSYPTLNDDFLNSMNVTPSGEIILSGNRSGTSGDNDYSVLKLDLSGAMQWYKMFGTTSFEASVLINSIMAGAIYTAGNRDGSQLPFISKINNSGNILWSKTFGSTVNAEDARIASVAADGSVMLFGTLPALKNFLLKTNPDGSVAWHNTYSTTHEQFPASMKITKDGGAIVASTDYRCDSAGCQAYFSFIKFDSIGNVSWAKAVDGFLGWGKDAAETADGGFVFTGQLQDSSGYKPVLFKTDYAGKFLWCQAYGTASGSGIGLFVQETFDGGFVLFGTENTLSQLIKTDANGNSGCNEKQVPLVFSTMNFVNSTMLNLPAVSSSENIFTLPNTETSIVVSDSLICQTLGINNQEAKMLVTIYPNPFSEYIMLELSLPNDAKNNSTKFILYDVFGRQILNQNIVEAQTAIHIKTLSGGMYLYRILNNEKTIASGKLISN